MIRLDHWLNRAAVAVLVISALGIVLKFHQLSQDLERSEREAASALLALDSAQAAHDTTRLILEGERATWQRRALQLAAERDTLDRLLRMETAARADLELRIRTMRDSIREPTVAGPDGTLTASFDVYREPVRLWADVRVSLDSAQLSFDTQIDPIPLELRVSCGEGSPRPALVNAQAPPWVTADIAAATFSPDVCNPAHPPEPAGPWRALGLGAALGALLSLLF